MHRSNPKMRREGHGYQPQINPQTGGNGKNVNISAFLPFFFGGEGEIVVILWSAADGCHPLRYRVIYGASCGDEGQNLLKTLEFGGKKHPHDADGGATEQIFQANAPNSAPLLRNVDPKGPNQWVYPEEIEGKG